MTARPKFLDSNLAQQAISVGALGLGTWGMTCMGVTDPSVLVAASTVLGLASNRMASASDRNQADRDWWKNLLVNEDVAKGVATAIERIIAEQGQDKTLPRHELAAKLAKPAYEHWVELAQAGAPFIEELQNSGVLTPLAQHMSGQDVTALEPGAWRAFLLHLVEDDTERADPVVQRLADHLANVLYKTLIPTFLNVVARDLESKGPLYAKITLRFQGKTYQNTEEIKAMLEDLRARLILAPVRVPPRQIPPAASEYFGRDKIVEELASRLKHRQHVDVCGGPGMGKTALAAKAMASVVGDNDASVAASPYPDGVVFLDLYSYKRDMDAAWQALANAFDPTLPTTGMSAEDRARMACVGRRALVILEGAEELEGDLNRFVSVLASETTRLVLTRDEKQTVAARRIHLDDLLDQENALKILRHLASVSGAQVPEEILMAIQERLGGHPLALTWAGSQLGDATQPPRLFLQEMQAEPFTALTEPGGNDKRTLRWMFDRSVRHMDEMTKKVLIAAGHIAYVPFGISLAQAAGSGKAALQRLTQLSFLRLSDDQQGWRFAHALAAQYAGDLLLPEGCLADLGLWALAELKTADGRYNQGDGYAALDQALSHATALLAHDDTGSVLRDLVDYLVYHDADYNAIGVRQGRLDFARRALGAFDLWLQHAPAELKGTDGWQRDLSISLDRIGNVSREQGDLGGALRAYEQGKVIAEKLAQKDPGNAGWQRDLSVSLNKVGDVSVEQGDLGGALRAYEQGKVIAKKLAQKDPGNAGWQRDLSVSLQRIGDVSREQGDLSGALRAYEQGKVIAEKLAQKDPGNAGWQRDLSVSLNKVGDVSREQGDLAGALRAYEQGKAIAEKLAGNDPGNVSWQRHLSVSLDRIGDVSAEQGDLAGALRAYEQSKGIRDKLAGNDPGNAGWQRDLFYSCWAIADTLVKEERWFEALPFAERTLQISGRLAIMDPSNVMWQKDVRVSRRMLAEIQEHLRKAESG